MGEFTASEGDLALAAPVGSKDVVDVAASMGGSELPAASAGGSCGDAAAGDGNVSSGGASFALDAVAAPTATAATLPYMFSPSCRSIHRGVPCRCPVAKESGSRGELMWLGKARVLGR